MGVEPPSGSPAEHRDRVHEHLAGRVGDVPQAGSEFYAGPGGAASATGAGEDIARANLARRTVDRLDAGHGAEGAADAAIGEFEARSGSTAGVILVDAAGAAGVATNSEEMQTAIAET